ncbi:sugar ABC transporter ATP-binding protein [Nocardioides albidus]|nr:sugar ABC transporter ATP-binding protein [Nocardioides albidus]
MSGHAAEASARGAIAVNVTGLRKAFGGVTAVEVDAWDLLPGEIHALAGENGAGKSTLCKILAGDIAPDEGTIEFDGHSYEAITPSVARSQGVALVHQELALAPLVTVAEVVALTGGYPRRLGLVDWRRLYREVQTLLDDWNLGISAKAQIRSLSTAQQVVVNTLAATVRQPRLIILDEPTASLSAAEVEHMHQLVRRLRDAGTTIVYITHRLDEIFEICDRVTVMRNSRWISTTPTSELTKPQLIEAIAGRPIVKRLSDGVAASGGQTAVLATHDLCVGQLGPLSLEVRAGEVVALAGLVGSGRTEFIEAIYGLRHPTSGSVEIRGDKTAIRTPRQAVRAGLGLVPEERRAAGLAMDMAVRENMLLGSMQRYSHKITRIVSRRRQKDAVAGMSDQVRLKSASLELPVRSLSGGNQQKVIFGRWMLRSPDVLLLDEPTRGVDVGAREDIFNLIRSLASQGKGIVLVSSDLEDLEGLASRAIVLQEGKVVGELHGSDITQDRILELCFAKSA